MIDYEAPLAQKIDFECVDVITSSVEDPHEILVTWGSLVAEVGSVSIFE